MLITVLYSLITIASRLERLPATNQTELSCNYVNNIINA
jgi:hypothetical protein